MWYEFNMKKMIKWITKLIYFNSLNSDSSAMLSTPFYIVTIDYSVNSISTVIKMCWSSMWIWCFCSMFVIEWYLCVHLCACVKLSKLCEYPGILLFFGFNSIQFNSTTSYLYSSDFRAFVGIEFYRKRLTFGSWPVQLDSFGLFCDCGIFETRYCCWAARPQQRFCFFSFSPCFHRIQAPENNRKGLASKKEKPKYLLIR